MKQYLKFLVAPIIVALLFFGVAQGASIFFPYQGGTGTSTAPAKGSVMTGYSTTQYGPFAVGADGECLQASSGAVSGLAWGTCGSGGGGDGWWRASGGNISPTTTAYAVSVGSTTNYGPLSIFSTSTGSHILTVSDNGRLGIGTTTPGNVLSVVGASTLNGSTTINGLVYGWPVSHTASGYLKNNGTGGLSWETVTPGSSFTTTSINGVVSTAFTFATSTAGNISLSITTSSDTVTFNLSVNANYGIPLTASTTQWNGLFNASSSWNTAYGWGNHATAGYHSSSSLSAVSPLNYNSVTGAFSVTSSYDIPLSASSTQWNTAFNWGNHASAGYLTSVGSDSTWTLHNSYPAACSAGNYVTAIGDTLTCSIPAGSVGYNYWGLSGNNLTPSSTAYMLGVGTTTPNAMLSVLSTASVRPLQFASSSGDDMLVMTTGGSIGIGTTTPVAMLALQPLANVIPMLIASSTGASIFKIQTDGSVLVGTSTQTGTLFSVASSTGASYFSVNRNGSITIPNSASAITSSTGELALDTTNDQLRFYGTSTGRVIPYWQDKCFTVFDATTSDDAVPIWQPFKAIQVLQTMCKTSSSTIPIEITDGTNSMGSTTCSTTMTLTVPSSNNTWTQGETMQFNSGTAGGGGIIVNYCITYAIIPD